MEPIIEGNWKPLALMVVDRIREALIRKELRPGDKLPSETELVSTFGVARTSIREAIKMLQAIGILEVRRGDGTYVTESIPKATLDVISSMLALVPGSVDAITELREMFEIAYTHLAISKMTEDDLTKIRQATERLIAAVREGRQTADDDLAFHHAILEATHNPYVEQLGKSLMQFFEVSIDDSVRKNPQRAIDDHLAILDAIEKRDMELAAECIRKSFSYWRTNVT